MGFRIMEEGVDERNQIDQEYGGSMQQRDEIEE
jgi:hypothetical protein